MYQTIILYTLCLYDVVYQLYLNKVGEKENYGYGQIFIHNKNYLARDGSMHFKCSFFLSVCLYFYY